MYYRLYEMSHAALAPWRAVADATRLFYSNPINPASHTHIGKQIAAGAELFERSTRRYGKPEFGITRTTVSGIPVEVTEEIVWNRPFCNLIHFRRTLPAGKAAKQPKNYKLLPLLNCLHRHKRIFIINVKMNLLCSISIELVA